MFSYTQLLQLEGHEEGGYFGLFYKSPDKISPLPSRYKNNTEEKKGVERSAGSSIYYLLEKEGFSAWHRLLSDEIWHYYDGGSPIDIHVIDSNGKLTTHTLGNPGITKNAVFQVIVKAGDWFAAEVRDKSSFGLVGCTVSPGFEYYDFELAEKYRDELVQQHPNLADIFDKFIKPNPIRFCDKKPSNHDINLPLTKLSASQYIEKLRLTRHPEGGYFGEVYRAKDMVLPLETRYKNNNIKDSSESNQQVLSQYTAGTSIYYLLSKHDFSAWHRLKSDEIWHYYDGGSPIDLHVIDQNGNLKTHVLGNPRTTKEAVFQVVIRAGDWFAAEVRDKSTFSLVGCTVSPGFEFSDFELAKRNELILQYPQHTGIINQLTRVAPSACSQSWSSKKAIAGYATVALLAGFGIYSLLNENSIISTCFDNVKNKLIL